MFKPVPGGLRYANELVALIHSEFPDFGIAVAGVAEPHSGCVSFGLERWMLAILARHGLEGAAQLCS